MPGQQVEAIATCDGTLEKPTSGRRRRSISPAADESRFDEASGSARQQRCDVEAPGAIVSLDPCETVNRLLIDDAVMGGWS